MSRSDNASILADRIRLDNCSNVYDPREDSYIMANAVERYAFGKTLDLGCGTGIQGIIASMKKCDVTFSDIDNEALKCARRNAALNGIEGKFVLSDMFESIEGKFNTIIFNPPYVPSGHKRHVALDGGRRGRELIDRFLSSYRHHVLEKHRILLLESSLNGYEADLERLGARIVSKGHYFFEDLVVLLFR